MSDAHPTAVDGEKCYAILGWSDWKDSLAGQDFMPYYGWFKLNNTTFAKGDGSTVTSIFDESMPMKNYLKQLNNLWNEGYIHPDSVNMDYSTAKAKIDSGHGLITAVEWMGGKYNDLSTDETGNMTVWAKDFEVYINSDSPVGSNRVLAISKDCTNIDAALRFINWYYSPTAYNIIKNGPEGYLWEYADDGTQVFKEDGIERYRTNREEIGSGGDLFVAQQFINEQPYTAYVINPTTGQPLYHEYWDSFYETEQRWGQLEWRKQTGYTRTVDMAAAQGAKTKSTAFSLMPSIDPSLEATNTAIADAWYTYSWKLLMAKDDVEFEALWKEFEKDCKDLGDDATFEWYKTEFEKAQTQADKYPLNKTWE
jgi:putative aldouronate transport system substrate-binding protein